MSLCSSGGGLTNQVEASPRHLVSRVVWGRQCRLHLSILIPSHHHGCCPSGCRCWLLPPPAPSTHRGLPASPCSCPQTQPLRRAFIAFFFLVFFCSFRYCCRKPLRVYNFFVSTKLLPWRVKNLDQRKQHCSNFYRTFYYFLKCAMSIHTTLLRKPSAQVFTTS